ncbi:MAG: hypothetical protein LH606_07305 [Cytophagaceae bacterium]|nr:hypothetical protein [Cytophagaceae bacterium]
MKLHSFKPTALRSKVKLLGVGGSGSLMAGCLTACNLPDVDVIACSTDAYALRKSIAPYKLLLGQEGTDTDQRTDVNYTAALACVQQIRSALEGSTDLLVLLVGLGGVIGTGTVPVVARLARELGIPTVAVVTMPFEFEGKIKMEQARWGLAALVERCDAVLVHDLQDLLRLSPKIGLDEVYAQADERISQSVQTLLEPLKAGATTEVLRFVKGAGRLHFGFGTGRGENRARQAACRAVHSLTWDQEQLLSTAQPQLFMRVAFSQNYPPTVKEQRTMVKSLGTLGRAEQSKLLYTDDATWRQEIDCSVLIRFVE